eukprot:403366034
MVISPSPYNRQHQIQEDDKFSSDFEQLIQQMYQTFDQNSLSLKFKDKNLEKEYQIQLYEQIKRYADIYIYENIAILALYFITIIYKAAYNVDMTIQLKTDAVICSTLLINVIFCILSKKFLVLGLYCGLIQTIIITILNLEVAIYMQQVPSIATFTMSIFLIATLSYMCYCKLEQFIVYVACWVYIIIRSYFWARGHPLFKEATVSSFSVQIGLYLFLMLFFLYFFARENQKRDREVYKEKNNQRQVIALFNSIIRTHHDGITITQGEDIIFHNHQISKIMNIQTPQNTSDASQQLNLSLVNESGNTQMQQERTENSDQKSLVKSQIIEAMKKTKIHQNQMVEKLLLQMQINLSSSQNDLAQNQSNLLNTIWDYILIQNQQQEQILNSNSSHISMGINFKLKSEDENGSIKNKKLQVFSQIINTGQKTFVVTTIRDMSHWMELEKEKNITLYKTQAFASAAHEFRNPLGAIIHSLDLMKDSIDYEKGYKFYKIAKNCSNLMLYLVNDILDYSQIESQKLLLNYESTDIESVLEECTGVLKFKAELKDLDLSYSIDRSFPSQFMVDQNRLRQILINLISNAIKYTNEGFVRIHCYLQSYKQQIVIEVQDSGVGIDKNQIQNLFIAYNKIMKNRNLNKEGCGLGLTISKNLSQAMGGDLKVSSVLGQGSEFAIILPFNPSMHMNKQKAELIKIESKNLSLINSNMPQMHPTTSFFPKVSKRANEDNFDIKLEFPERSVIHSFQIKGHRIQSYDLGNQQNFSKSKQQQNINSSINKRNSESLDLEFKYPSVRITKLESQIPSKVQQNINKYMTESIQQTPRLQNVDTDSSSELFTSINDYNLQTNRRLNCSFNYNNQNEVNYFQKSPFFQLQTTNLSIKKTKNISINQETEKYQIIQLEQCSQFDITQRDHTLSVVDIAQEISNIQPQSLECPCPKILIADDDPFNVMALQGLIDQIHTGPIDKAFNGRDALSKFEQNHKASKQNCNYHQAYKLVVLDNQMPFLRGIEVAKNIREIQNNSRQGAKLVLLSGDDFSQQISLEIKEIFDYVIKKPVSMAILKSIVLKVFNEQ